MKHRAVAERVFGLVLRLYPAEFRDRFGHGMTSAYRAARMEAAARGRAGVAAFWIGVAVDALVRAPGEHVMMTLYDLKFAARALWRAPVFSVVAIATLALGIGVNTAIFSVVHAVAIQPLGFFDPARLVRIWEKNDRLNIAQFSTSVPNYLSWREHGRSFAELAAWRSGTVTLTGTGEPHRLGRMEATATLILSLVLACSRPAAAIFRPTRIAPARRTSRSSWSRSGGTGSAPIRPSSVARLRSTASPIRSSASCAIGISSEPRRC